VEGKEVRAVCENVAHVYPQRRWHDSVYVVGDDAALRALGRAVKQALSEGRGDCETFAADGEGYGIVGIRLRDPGLWEMLRLPYVGDCAADRREEALGPRELLARLRRALREEG